MPGGDVLLAAHSRCPALIVDVSREHRANEKPSRQFAEAVLSDATTAVHVTGLELSASSTMCAGHINWQHSLVCVCFSHECVLAMLGSIGVLAALSVSIVVLLPRALQGPSV